MQHNESNEDSKNFIPLKFSSPFYHQTNGLTERVNSVIEQYLRCYTNFKGSNRKDFLS